jgi:phosphoglycerate kinase
MPPNDAFRSIDELDLAHQRVLIRVDFDVPLDAEGGVANDRKLHAALPTINKALKESARVVLATHLGAEGEPAVSLVPVAERLAELLGQEVYLPDECVGDAARKVVSDLREGQLCLLENLRFESGESQNDDSFARKLLGLCDVYVGEAFGCAHLTQASLVALPRLVKDRGIGFRFKAELEALTRVTQGVQKPFIGILGGAKLSKAQTMLEAMMSRCTTILVGGGVANTLLAARGADMKESSVEKDQLAFARNVLTRARNYNIDLVLPVDVLVARSDEATEGASVSVGSIPDGSGAFDIGPRTLDTFRSRLADAKLALWHGALGVCENAAFSSGTQGMLSALAEAPAYGIVTGDSVAAATSAELESKIGFVSTGGVASLVFIEGKKLPGASALSG